MQVDLHEIEMLWSDARWLELMAEVEVGGEVVLIRDGVPAAKLVSYLRPQGEGKSWSVPD